MSEIVDIQLLEDVADMKPSANESESREESNPGRRPFDLAEWIASREVPVRRESAWNGTGYKWVLEECPWNGHTDNAAFVVQWPDGTIGAGCHHNSCQQYGWRDLRQHYEPGCYDKREAGGTASRDHDGHAPEESNGESSSSRVPRFPTEVLPRTLRRFVEEAAASIGCPPEYVAVPMLATLGSAIGNGVVLEAKGGYTESATLYTAIIGDPGTSKTPAFNLATAPAQRKQEELAREYREAVAEYNRENNEDILSEPPLEPILRRTVVQDTTVEALAERLAENRKGLLVSNDEISGWVRSMDQYKGGKGNDRQNYLSLWSNGSIIVDRKGRHGPLMISRPFACIAGGIQPGVLSEIKNNRDDGLLDRFLFAYPDRVPYRWSEDEVSEDTVDAYRRIYEELYGLPVRTDENGVPAPRHATFLPSAKEAFVEAIHSLSAETERPDFPGHLKGPWSKMRAYLLRLSLIIAMSRLAQMKDLKPRILYDYMKTQPVIKERDVKAAVAIVEYFKAHARRVYAKLHDHRKERTTTAQGARNAGTDKGTDLAQYLEEFVRERGGKWHGMTSQLYEICQAARVSGMPGGVGPFGKLVRKIADDPDTDLLLDEGWRGKDPIMKLSLSTLGTVGGAGVTRTDTTESTESRTESEQVTAVQPNPDVDGVDPLADIREAIEKLFDDHPESMKEPEPETIAVELFWYDYLDHIPDEGEVQEVLDFRIAR